MGVIVPPGIIEDDALERRPRGWMGWDGMGWLSSRKGRSAVSDSDPPLRVEPQVW
jgi:hypothetical protein